MNTAVAKVLTHPVLMVFADGTMFFVGTAVLVAGLTLLQFCRRAWLQVALVAAVLIGVLMVAVSAAPFPAALYVGWAVVFLLALYTAVRAGPGRSAVPRVVMFLLFVAVSGLLCGAEAPYRRLPVIKVRADRNVYVVGDSLSAGTGAERQAWPLVLGRKANLCVINLARPGEIAGSAMGQIGQIPDTPSVVIVELGGNDILGKTIDDDFEQSLDTILKELSSKRHRVIMFEIPLPPLKNSFGRIQRKLAAEYEVTLIPKRVMAHVLGLEGGTLDGLHLSQRGHDELAFAVKTMLDVTREEQGVSAGRPAEWAQPMAQDGVPNLYWVSDSLCRSAQPSAEGMRNMKKLGIVTVVNLRSFHSDRDEIADTGIAYEHIRMKAWHPEEEDAVRFLQIVTDPARMPVLVHCQHGADRTGTMCALYRIVVQGWTRDEAIREMTDGGFRFHGIWQNLANWIEELDTTEIARKAGLPAP